MVRAVQSVMASLVWFGTIGGERPCVPKNVSIGSKPAGEMTGVGFPGSRSRYPLPDKWRGTASANMDQQILGDSRSRAGVAAP
jgi:hypothetical protein